MAVVKGGIPGGGYVGRFGNAVFYESAGRTIMRERVSGTNPRTAEQQAGRHAQGAVARRWGTIPDEAAAAWEAFAAGEGTTGYLLYLSLTRRWLRVHPGGEPPEGPPPGPFFGDAVGVRIGSETSGVQTPSPTVPPSGRSSLQGAPSPESSVLTLVASQPNAEGVVTEVLAQPLASRRRKPRARDWKSRGFVAFAAGSPVAEVPLPPGVYAVGYRFVSARTGQATAMAAIGVATVG